MDTKIYSLIVLLQYKHISLKDLDRIIYESNCTDELLQGIKAQLEEQENDD